MSKETSADFWQASRARQAPALDPLLPVPLSLLLALVAQIEADAVELESTTRWCRDLPALKDQGALPATWDRLTALLRAAGYAP